MTTGFIICGALGREVLDIIQKHGWDAEVIGVSAMDHMFPERIAPDVETRILALRKKAQAAADYLGLPLEIRNTGYGLLEERLLEKMTRR